MTTEIVGSELVGNEFPPEEGARLAKTLLDRDVDWQHITVDLRGLPPSLLISAFFNGFLAAINGERPDLLQSAKKIRWVLDHDFQYENVRRWMKGFVVAT
ncbi:MAG: hypothetical protein OXN90_03705 [Gemmatimonadota bacterium]|nr:hypothetical protein [Gemmatimonadota bacterium]